LAKFYTVGPGTNEGVKIKIIYNIPMVNSFLYYHGYLG